MTIVPGAQGLNHVLCSACGLPLLCAIAYPIYAELDRLWEPACASPSELLPDGDETWMIEFANELRKS